MPWHSNDLKMHEYLSKNQRNMDDNTNNRNKEFLIVDNI